MVPMRLFELAHSLRQEVSNSASWFAFFFVADAGAALTACSKSVNVTVPKGTHLTMPAGSRRSAESAGARRRPQPAWAELLANQIARLLVGECA